MESIVPKRDDTQDETPPADEQAPTWESLPTIKAVVTLTCVCGGEHETDFTGRECDGTTSVEWKCDDCARPLLVYVDVDARVRTRPTGGGDRG